MNSAIIQWAIRHHVSQQALAELSLIFGLDGAGTVAEADRGKDEAFVQSLVRLEASRKGVKLWRNNVGVLKNERGTPVRYGLANDSPQLNKVIKSGDLIGWRPLLIASGHVGMTIAQFVSRECKRPNWRYTGNDHEQAQLRWAQAIAKDGGDAGFCNGEGTL